MSIPIEIADKYMTTFIDFWRLRPRRFFPIAENSGQKYLTAAQFLVVSLGLAFIMLALAFTLTKTALDRAGIEEVVATPEALAGRMVVFFIANLLIGSLFYRAISRARPIGGGATFHDIFELQCYITSLVVPMAALDLLVGPFVVELVGNQSLPAWSVFIQFGFGALVGLIVFIAYQVPGMAYVNGVSTGRFWCGLLFWSFAFGLLFWIVVLAMVAIAV